jgi:hypothetical protein
MFTRAMSFGLEFNGLGAKFRPCEGHDFENELKFYGIEFMPQKEICPQQVGTKIGFADQRLPSKFRPLRGQTFVRCKKVGTGGFLSNECLGF